MGPIRLRLFRFGITAVVPLLYGCTTCQNTVLADVPGEKFVARAIHRVCGSASGFHLELYPVGGHPPGRGEGCLEPFQSACACPAPPPTGSRIPLRARWDGPHHLVVQWDEWLPQDEAGMICRHLPRRAELEYLGVTITYDPPLAIPTPLWCSDSQ
jgi:hypothetical protein